MLYLLVYAADSVLQSKLAVNCDRARLSRDSRILSLSELKGLRVVLSHSLQYVECLTGIV